MSYYRDYDVLLRQVNVDLVMSLFPERRSRDRSWLRHIIETERWDDLGFDDKLIAKRIYADILFANSLWRKVKGTTRPEAWPKVARDFLASSRPPGNLWEQRLASLANYLAGLNLVG